MMADWKRATLPVTSETRGVFLSGVLPTITLRATQDAGLMRIGLWVVDTRLAGWVVPYLPANIPFTIRDGKASAFVNGVRQDLPRQLRDWDGVRWPSRSGPLPYGTLTLTLDQVPGADVSVLVDVTVESVETV